MMERRQLLACAGAAVLGAPALVGFAQQTVTLRFHTFMGPQSHVFLNMHKPWMDKVQKDSGGRIRFEAYAAMQLGGTAAQLYDQCKDGVADVIWTMPAYTAGRFPRLEAFDLPFMMTSAEATSKACWDYLQTVAQDEFKDTQLLAINTHGPGVIHTSSQAVRSVADLRGLKLRGPSRQATRLLAALGAIPVGMPLPGIPDALSKGTIGGCVLPWEVVPSVKVEELTRFHTEFAPAGGALYTANFALVMNKARYQSLPPELKKAIDANTGQATCGWLGRVQQQGDAAGRQAAQARGNTIVTLGQAQAQAFRGPAQAVENGWVQEMDKKGLDGRQLLTAARSLIARHSAGVG